MTMVETAVDSVLAVFRYLRVSRRLLALEEKVRALDAASLPRYEGVYEYGKRYPPGSLTTKSGGLWLAVEPTDTTPGQGASGWKLIVKAGAA